ncbi:MAG: TetR-like C-terminal domain-containing protein [Pseudomonadota bacterium]
MARAKRSAETTDAMRRELIAAARAMIARDGIHGLTARGLAQELGWAVGTIYTVAPSLDVITLEANAAELDALRGALEAALDQAAPDPTAQVLALARGYLAFAESRPRNWSAIFERQAESGDGPPDWYQARQLALFDLLERTLRPLAGSATEARWAARSFWAALQGFLALSMAGHVERVAEDPETGRRQDLAAYLVEMLLSGLAARRG